MYKLEKHELQFRLDLLLILFDAFVHIKHLIYTIYFGLINFHFFSLSLYKKEYPYILLTL